MQSGHGTSLKHTRVHTDTHARQHKRTNSYQIQISNIAVELGHRVPLLLSIESLADKRATGECSEETEKTINNRSRNEIVEEVSGQ